MVKGDKTDRAMSKRWIGGPKYGRRYPDSGTPALTYFRKTRHHRIARNGYKPLRWKLYIAKGWIMEATWDREAIKLAEQIERSYE